eukprot:1152168-Pelagomonas_calceolata.AAC.15
MGYQSVPLKFRIHVHTYCSHQMNWQQSFGARIESWTLMHAYSARHLQEADKPQTPFPNSHFNRAPYAV